MINLFFDVETTGPSPIHHELIQLAMVATDTSYNILGEFNEFCRPEGDRIYKNIFGYEVNQWPDPSKSKDKSKWNATDVHGILWEQAKDFQLPIDLYRKLWVFIDSLPKDKINMVFHSQTQFDPKFLFYRANIYAPKMYQELVSRTYFYEPDPDHGECFHRLRYDDTMGMARAYIKNASDGLKTAQKLQKTIDKNRGYLTRDRKTPASPAQIKKWQDALAQAENDIILIQSDDVVLEGYSLDKICRSLDIQLSHHDALSDTKALIPIHEFLSNNL